VDGGHREMIDRAVTDRLGFAGSAVRSASLAALPRSRTKRCRRGRTGRYRNALWCRPGRSRAVSGSQILCRSRVCSACRIIPFNPTPRPKMGTGSSERRVSRSRLSAGGACPRGHRPDPWVDPPHAVVLSIDEKSQIQALDRTQPGLPIKPGRCQTLRTITSGTAPPPCSPRSACSTAR